MPTLDVSALTAKQVEKAVSMFDQMCYKQLRPIHEITNDVVRKELDERFGREVLRLSNPILGSGEGLEVLRMKLAQEPSIRGSK